MAFMAKNVIAMMMNIVTTASRTLFMAYFHIALPHLLYFFPRQRGFSPLIDRTIVPQTAPDVNAGCLLVFPWRSNARGFVRPVRISFGRYYLHIRSVREAKHRLVRRRNLYGGNGNGIGHHSFAA